MRCGARARAGKSSRSGAEKQQSPRRSSALNHAELRASPRRAACRDRARRCCRCRAEAHARAAAMPDVPCSRRGPDLTCSIRCPARTRRGAGRGTPRRNDRSASSPRLPSGNDHGHDSARCAGPGPSGWMRMPGMENTAASGNQRFFAKHAAQRFTVILHGLALGVSPPRAAPAPPRQPRPITERQPEANEQRGDPHNHSLPRDAPFEQAIEIARSPRQSARFSPASRRPAP